MAAIRQKKAAPISGREAPPAPYVFAYIVVPDGIPAQPHGPSGPLGQLMKLMA